MNEISESACVLSASGRESGLVALKKVIRRMVDIDRRIYRFCNRFDNTDFNGYNLASVRIITIGLLKRFWHRYPAAENPLCEWYAKANLAIWRNPVDVAATFPQVDRVQVRSGNTVFVFNITRAFRLIAAIHFDFPRVFVLRILTHKEYDEDRWKDEL